MDFEPGVLHQPSIRAIELLGSVQKTQYLLSGVILISLALGFISGTSTEHSWNQEYSSFNVPCS